MGNAEFGRCDPAAGVRMASIFLLIFMVSFIIFLETLSPPAPLIKENGVPDVG